ncbi:ATP-binding protein [Cellulomonas fengjieae]|uniref:histidine kinase n=1 Tax=Cellulomonas fengjieae TaxID=2819978 RepID=A0ABS3SI24_9CELL|nr:ATP-binding protein [Cellulomonas fengjieae]MBO3084621.1 HAMP domain-containing protein [Cellulomonas fengjieae]QVI67053.1 HAMP domain-containing protein [Cellulomonas fengjieae]
MSVPGGRRGASLRLRLTLIASGAVCVALVVGAVALTGVLRSTRVDALGDVARDRAATVAALASEDRLPESLPVAEPGEIVQLIDEDGAVLATSPNASRTLPVVPTDVLAGLSGVSTTQVSAYDDAARVAVRATTYQGSPATVVATVPLTEVQGVLDALRVALAVVVPLLTVALGVVVWLILGRALRPVEELRRGAALVASSGGPGSLPVPARDDELGALARTLNSMLDRLEAGAERQRAFVADAAHELRSPLAALRTSIEVARAHPDSYGTDELASDLEGEVLRMQVLVDDLLLLARVGSTPLEDADLDLAEVARDAVRPSDPVTVTGAGRARGDARAAARVVRNLVDNAVRHAASRVEVVLADGVVRVDDDGAGLAPADRERVFERFVRLDEARERDAGGSGLGLAIAREIAREQGGDVVLGVAELGGLRAELRLPR